MAPNSLFDATEDIVLAGEPNPDNPLSHAAAPKVDDTDQKKRK
jgi:hypothetical protein